MRERGSQDARLQEAEQVANEIKATGIGTRGDEDAAARAAEPSPAPAVSPADAPAGGNAPSAAKKTAQ